MVRMRRDRVLRRCCTHFISPDSTHFISPESKRAVDWTHAQMHLNCQQKTSKFEEIFLSYYLGRFPTQHGAVLRILAYFFPKCKSKENSKTFFLLPYNITSFRALAAFSQLFATWETLRTQLTSTFSGNILPTTQRSPDVEDIPN